MKNLPIILLLFFCGCADHFQSSNDPFIVGQIKESAGKCEYYCTLGGHWVVAPCNTFQIGDTIKISKK